MQTVHSNGAVRGLTDAEAKASRAADGANVLSPIRRTSFFCKVLAGFSDPIIRILAGALCINFLFCRKTFDLPETIGILAAMLTAVLISALSERGGERAFDRLQAESAKSVCRCLRGGVLKELSSEELVCGDLVTIGAGERIPADGVLVSGELRVSLAALTGEEKELHRVPPGTGLPGPEQKWLPENPQLLFGGSSITWGSGQMVLCRVGDRTLYGSLAGSLAGETRDSPLRTRLSRLARQMSAVGYAAGALAALSYLISVFREASGGSPAALPMLFADRAFVFSSLLHALMLATTMLVVAVPEGLPMMISVVLSSNIHRMQKDRVLVRKPVGIETAGSMNLLFTDKTGTLTCGRPEVFSVISADGRSFASYAALEKAHPYTARAYLASACGNTESHPVHKDGRLCASGGNSTDRAILQSVLSSGLRPPKLSVSAQIPFDSARKFSSACVGGVTYVKGAPDVLFPRISAAKSADGTRSAFDRETVLSCLEALSCKAARVLVLCEEENGELVFLCLIAIRDELRKEAKDAVRKLRGAGIQVVMMTGDSRETAEAIAREAGILEKVPEGVPTDAAFCGVLTSSELAERSDAELRKMLPDIRVLARALPQDKSRLVRLAQESGLTVGMTGDGVNDTPALKIADVGFAMGSGTAAAQEAGDIVILDDNISSIARAVLYGRTIFESIRKFIMFQMTTNVCAVGISVICPLLGTETPLTVLQMLWINLIMDTLGSLAFAGEAPAKDTMKLPPKKRTAPLLSRYMAGRVLLMGSFLLGLSLFFMESEALREHFGYYEEPSAFLGAFFAFFIFADICNSASARTPSRNPFHGLSGNPAFIVIFSLILICQLLMIYHGGAMFRCVPLSLPDLLLVSAMAGSVLLYSIPAKAVLSHAAEKRCSRKL